jgi:hypothetical protein
VSDGWVFERPPGVNEAFSVTTTDGKDVPLKAPASVCTASDSVSNEIDEGELQKEKRSEQRI